MNADFPDCNSNLLVVSWAAISADGETILWVLGIPIYASRLVYTHDMGQSWGKSLIYDAAGNLLDGDALPFKVMSDRVHPDLFYGFSENKNGKGFYVSPDKGVTFHQVKAPDGFPEVNLAGIDGRQDYEIRVEPGREGDGGVSWLRINDDNHQYGDIRSISGDPRVFGRIYVATGTRGIVYGDICEN